MEADGQSRQDAGPEDPSSIPGGLSLNRGGNGGKEQSVRDDLRLDSADEPFTAQAAQAPTGREKSTPPRARASEPARAR